MAAIAQLLRRNDWALRCYAKALLCRPRHAVTWAQIAFLHAQAGDRARAIDAFEQAVAIDPRDADSWFNLGFLRQESDQHAAAIAAFDRAVTLNPRHDRAWYGKGLSLVRMNAHLQALVPFKINIKLQPMSPHGYLQSARAHFALGDLARCERRMRALKAFDPKNAALLEDETGINVGVERWWQP
jgi:tetratricopeptide (TPR) repeat protein